MSYTCNYCSPYFCIIIIIKIRNSIKHYIEEFFRKISSINYTVMLKQF